MFKVFSNCSKGCVRNQFLFFVSSNVVTPDPNPKPIEQNRVDGADDVEDMIRNGRPMTNRQIKTEINSKRGKDDQINQYAISGAVISLENAKKLEKAGYVKSDGPRSDLVIEYQLVTK